MSEFDNSRKAARETREALRAAERTLYARWNTLRQKQSQLIAAVRRGGSESDAAKALAAEVQALEAQVARDSEILQAAVANLGRILAEFPDLEQPWDLVEELNDDLPFLMLPVRLETRFMSVDDGKELWVRIFPDAISVHTHEETLTEDEFNAGITYWIELWNASQESDLEERRRIEKGAWRALAEAFGGTRAGWIRGATQPESLEVESAEDLVFPEFDLEDLKQESWSRAPRSNIMPDRFVVMGFTGDEEVFRHVGNPIPDPLILGPDPLQIEDEYQQQDGELLVGEDMAWIYDFDEAVEAGMALRIPLQEPFATEGFDRVLAIGLRLTSDADENQELLEELLANHHYAPDGMSLLPQGTPTNNTEGKGSGFSSEDPGAEASFAAETGEALFDPTDEPFEKKDGQILAEALGINHAVFEHIPFADQRDMVEAKAMNKALWQGTLGYYLEEMLELDLTPIALIREFFTDFVTGRGPIPAIRVGAQPYGVLLTSDFSQWNWSPEFDEGRLDFLNQLLSVTRRLETKWRGLVPQVPHFGAPGDPYDNLLSMLGLHATSVEHHRRHAVGKEYLWNYEVIAPGTFSGRAMMAIIEELALALLEDLGLEFEEPPKLFDLAFLLGVDEITAPLVDDIPVDEVEKLSETKLLRSIYRVPNPEGEPPTLLTNYIGWFVYSAYEDIKKQAFEDGDGERLSVPSPLLYRMLRGALMQAHYDTTMKLYTSFELLSPLARREVELGNIEEERTVTRWEFMDADVSAVMPQLTQESISVGQFLQTDEGLDLPEVLSLREVRECLKLLIDVPTARLERIFVEHLDLCTYRLDAWQTGFFTRRLQQQRYPVASEGAFENRTLGIHLGAFGWVEDLRPAPELAPIDPTTVPISLHDPQRDGPLYEQPENGGFIHGPSLNHAVAAAVLRNAYITHFDPAEPEKMAVNLSSERVRTALAFLEGIRNGQELGALLGYQFERGLHDRHGDPSLNRYLPFFKQAYPLVADKITEDELGEQIETKEARNVFDGYELLEAAFLREPPLTYPYGVDGLPANPNSAHGRAIQSEVLRMAESFDAIADLALAEGVYQVTQGNFDRAGAMLKALTEGNNPPDPEIVQTPRSGAALTQRVALHLETSGALTSPWPGVLSVRASLEPGLNKWLGERLPPPNQIQFAVRLGDALPVVQDLSALGLHPIDLIHLIGDELADQTTELESRIAHENRRAAGDDALEVRIDFMAELTDPQAVTLFELLPLIGSLREIATGGRPLAANDFALPSEITSDPAEDPNPGGYDVDELRVRVETALTAFENAVNALELVIPPPDVEGDPDPALTDAEALRTALRTLADFGVPDAFPLSAVDASDQAKSTLVGQAVRILEIVNRKLSDATQLKTDGDNTTLVAAQRVDHYRQAAKAIFGAAFNLIPRFGLADPAELAAARDFRDAAPANSLTRHHQANPFIVEEWLQGLSKVRPRLGVLESIKLLGQAIVGAGAQLKPLQLPFRESDHWVAVEYTEVAAENVDDPDVFVPEGDFLSIVQWLPESGFDPAGAQSGLLIDEWIETIPGKTETTGIAVHYDQPSTEPPQVLLLAVTPQVTGAWSWDKLVGILLDTLERARLRAAEPDQLARTALGHLLPAVLSPVTSYPYGTISTDYVWRTMINAVETFPEDE